MLGTTLLPLETNVFHAGDEYFSVGDEHVENTCSSFSHTDTDTNTHTDTHTQTQTHTHIQLAASDFQAEFMWR